MSQLRTCFKTQPPTAMWLQLLNYSHVWFAVALHPIIEALLTARVNTEIQKIL